MMRPDSPTPPLPSTHRVVSCLGGSRTALETRPLPRPGPGEILLRLRASGLCGTDLFKLEAGSAAAGQVLGHEIVGEVAALGEGAGRFRLGDRIAVPHHVPCGDCALCRRGSETLCRIFRENLLLPGGFAEYVLVRPRAVSRAARRLPEQLSDGAAVFLEPAACVLRGIQRAGLGPEGLAAVQGAGSMGLLHLLVLRAALPGVEVAAIDPIPERRRLALELGARDAAAPGGEARELVQRLSGGLGADAVFDTAGGPGPLEAALGLAREGGSIVLFAHAPGAARAGFELNALFKHEHRLLGTYSGALREQEEIFRLLESGRLDPSPLITHRLPLEAFEEGVALMRERRALKVLFVNTT